MTNQPIEKKREKKYIQENQKNNKKPKKISCTVFFPFNL